MKVQGPGEGGVRASQVEKKKKKKKSVRIWKVRAGCPK